MMHKMIPLPKTRTKTLKVKKPKIPGKYNNQPKVPWPAMKQKTKYSNSLRKVLFAPSRVRSNRPNPVHASISIKVETKPVIIIIK